MPTTTSTTRTTTTSTTSITMTITTSTTSITTSPTPDATSGSSSRVTVPTTATTTTTEDLLSDSLLDQLGGTWISISVVVAVSSVLVLLFILCATCCIYALCRRCRKIRNHRKPAQTATLSRTPTVLLTQKHTKALNSTDHRASSPVQRQRIDPTRSFAAEETSMPTASHDVPVDPDEEYMREAIFEIKSEIKQANEYKAGCEQRGDFDEADRCAARLWQLQERLARVEDKLFTLMETNAAAAQPPNASRPNAYGHRPNDVDNGYHDITDELEELQHRIKHAETEEEADRCETQIWELLNTLKEENDKLELQRDLTGPDSKAPPVPPAGGIAAAAQNNIDDYGEPAGSTVPPAPRSVAASIVQPGYGATALGDRRNSFASFASTRSKPVARARSRWTSDSVRLPHDARSMLSTMSTASNGSFLGPKKFNPPVHHAPDSDGMPPDNDAMTYVMDVAKQMYGIYLTSRPSDPPTRLATRTVLASNYLIYLKAATKVNAPARAGVLLFAVDKLITSYCERNNLDGKAFANQLTSETLQYHQALEGNLSAAGMYLWTSPLRLPDDNEFCSVLNEAFRIDDCQDMAHTVIVSRTIIRNIVPFQVPADGCCWRGAGFNNGYKAFFVESKRFRVPGLLSTSKKESTARKFMNRVMPDQARVLWKIYFAEDRQHLTNVQYFRHSIAKKREHEYLFAPYSCFVVVCSPRWSDDPTEPHLITISMDNRPQNQSVFADGVAIAQKDAIPMTPWY